MDLPLMSDVFFEWLKLNGSRILRFYCMSEDDRMNVRLQRTLCASHITGENPEVYVLAHCRSPLWDETQAVLYVFLLLVALSGITLMTVKKR